MATTNCRDILLLTAQHNTNADRKKKKKESSPLNNYTKKSNYFLHKQDRDLKVKKTFI